MRLDHLLSKEEEVGVVLLFRCRGASRRRTRKRKGNPRRKVPVAMRKGETPVGRKSRTISNTMVKTFTADGTLLETAWESRWLPDFMKIFILWHTATKAFTAKV